ncbi:MAG: DUF1254 domain-containing protein [Proteobacteria bacterium]|nr:DUF1254 domain-containing protein [Pseudomonadota bacterium]
MNLTRTLGRCAVLALACLAMGQSPAQDLSPADLARRSVERRAVEAALWGMPLVNFDAMRQAYFRDAGAQYNDLIYWSRPSDWKNQTTTPNNSTLYVMFFANLKDGPVVVDVPPARDVALFGTLIDSWNLPLIDVGDDGQDKGQGGKYLLLPPGWKGEVPAGHIAVPSAMFNVYSLMRVSPKAGASADFSGSNAYIRQLRVYPLAAAAAPAPQRAIDMIDKRYEAIAPYDAGFYTMLARMVAEEPALPRDQIPLGQLRSLGIAKGAAFQPDAAANAVLGRAAAEAHANMVEGFRRAGARFWPVRQWRLLADTEVVRTRLSFVADGRLLVDERAYLFFGAFGAPKNPAPNLYVKAYEDAQGKPLDGAASYRLRVPANVPTQQFWSLNAYDKATAGFIREAAVVGLDSYNPRLQKNADGTVDLYLSPTPPPGRESNWIATAPGRPFFLMFRIYVPERAVLARSSGWSLADIERLN